MRIRAPRGPEFRKERIIRRESEPAERKRTKERVAAKSGRENRRIKYPPYFHGTLP